MIHILCNWKSGRTYSVDGEIRNPASQLKKTVYLESIVRTVAKVWKETAAENSSNTVQGLITPFCLWNVVCIISESYYSILRTDKCCQKNQQRSLELQKYPETVPYYHFACESYVVFCRQFEFLRFLTAIASPLIIGIESRRRRNNAVLRHIRSWKRLFAFCRKIMHHAFALWTNPPSLNSFNNKRKLRRGDLINNKWSKFKTKKQAASKVLLQNLRKWETFMIVENRWNFLKNSSTSC